MLVDGWVFRCAFGGLFWVMIAYWRFGFSEVWVFRGVCRFSVVVVVWCCGGVSWICGFGVW